jgi:hypothetical protein
MLTIEPEIQINSTAVPGVTYTVRNLNRIQRAEREFGLMEARYRVSELNSELAALAKEFGIDPDADTSVAELFAADATAAQSRRRALLWKEIGLIGDRDIKPATIKAGLISIQGVDVGDKAADVESILSGDPKTDALLDEIFAACEDSAGLLEKQRKNSASPTTSTVQVDGEQVKNLPTAEPAAA